MAKVSTTPGGLLVPTDSVSPEMMGGTASKAKALAKRSLQARMEAAAANEAALRANPYIWKPEIEYDSAKVPEHVGPVQEASNPLSKDEEAEFSKFMDFLAETLADRVDRWVEAGFHTGSWNFYLERGRLMLQCDPEQYNEMQRRHIADQVWDAISRVPNRYFDIEGR